MTEKSFVFDNKRERKIHELYLNPKGADVNFVFDADTDHPEKIPAHKIILSLDSPVFDTMFFGSIQEKGDIPIVDAPIAAFKEFLQLFYLNKVRLSSENIAHVCNLCKKYEVDEFKEMCETAFQKSLAIDDVCYGYGVAQLLEQKKLSKFCEEQIKKNPAEIINSDSFMECDSRLLRQILSLVSSNSKWNPLVTVIACMEWSKAQCKLNDLDINSKNLRHQLEDAFDQIPFAKLTSQEISQYVDLYDGFFTAEELKTLPIDMSLPMQPNSFSLQQKTLYLHLLQNVHPRATSGQILICDRRLELKLVPKYKNFFRKPPQESMTSFSSNKRILLLGFYAQRLKPTSYKFSVIQGKTIELNKYSNSNDITLQKPVVIEPQKCYRIRINIGYSDISSDQDAHELRTQLQLEDDIVITFHKTLFDNDYISQLTFQKCCD